MHKINESNQLDLDIAQQKIQHAWFNKKNIINDMNDRLYNIYNNLFEISNQLDKNYRLDLISQEKYLEYSSSLNNVLKIYGTMPKPIVMNDKNNLSIEKIESYTSFMETYIYDMCLYCGSNSIYNILDILLDENWSDNFNTKNINLLDFYNLIFSPINCYIISENKIQNKNINLDTVILKELTNNDNNNLLLLTQGCEICIPINNKIIIISGIFLKDSINILRVKNNLGIELKLKYINDMMNYSEISKNFISGYLNSMSLKDIILYEKEKIIDKIIESYNKLEYIKHMGINYLIKIFINANYIEKREIITLFLLDDTNDKTLYLTTILTDLINIESDIIKNNPNITPVNEIFKSLQHPIQNLFITHFKNIKNLSSNKIDEEEPEDVIYEKKIKSLDVPDYIKQKAMDKLKEYRISKDGNQSKAQTYLDGFLKIPFGTYKKELILNFLDKFKDDFNVLCKNSYDKIMIYVNQNCHIPKRIKKAEKILVLLEEYIQNKYDTENKLDEFLEKINKKILQNTEYKKIKRSNSLSNLNSQPGSPTNPNLLSLNGTYKSKSRKSSPNSSPRHNTMFNLCSALSNDLLKQGPVIQTTNSNIPSMPKSYKSNVSKWKELVESKKIENKNKFGNNLNKLGNNINNIGNDINDNDNLNESFSKLSNEINNRLSKLNIPTDESYIKNTKNARSTKNNKNDLIISNNVDNKEMIIDKISDISKNQDNQLYNIIFKIKEKYTEWVEYRQNKVKYINNVREILDKSVYGHKDAKTQLERVIGQWINGKMEGAIIGIQGPPGTGKTTLCKKGLAECLKDENGKPRPFAFLPLGGSSDGATLEGHGYTYVGSSWGKIVDLLMENKCMNPIIYIDELDKISNTERGREIVGILTHLTDSSQNKEFQDKYFQGIKFDLSKSLIVFSYNDSSLVDRILRDRILEIRTKPLTKVEKFNIFKFYLMPEILKTVGFSTDDFTINDKDIEYMIDNYTYEGGVRKLKEKLFEVVREINLRRMKDTHNYKFPIQLTTDLIDDILNHNNKIMHTKIHEKSYVGIMNGLFATTLGVGGLIQVECFRTYNEKRLDLELTGQQGDVMKESMKVAKTIVTNLLPRDILKNIHKDMDENGPYGLHIHCPEGATPKDGPSAGGAITLTILSQLTGIPIRNTVAMTGEIILKGNIRAIGGLQSKLEGAKMAGCNLVVIPKENEKDYNKIKEDGFEFNENFKVVTVSNIYEAIPYVFETNDLVFNKLV